MRALYYAYRHCSYIYLRLTSCYAYLSQAAGGGWERWEKERNSEKEGKKNAQTEREKTREDRRREILKEKKREKEGQK